jgi:hypothetical protein
MLKTIIETITLTPGVGHVFSSDEAVDLQFFNCGPGRVLVEDTLLSKGGIAAFSGSDPITLLCYDESDAVVIVRRALY